MSSEQPLAESSDSSSQPADTSSLPVEDAATDVASTDEESVSSAEEQAKPRRKVQLNPSAGMMSAKAAFPSATTAGDSTDEEQVDAAAEPPAPQESTQQEVDQPAAVESVEQVAETTEAVETESVETDDAAADQLAEAISESEALAPVSSAAVDLDDIDAELGIDLEQEIEAAMSQSQDDALQATAAVAPVQEDGVESSPAVISEDELEEGTRLQGTISSVHGDDVFVEVGLRFPAVVPSRQFEGIQKTPEVGMQLEVVVDRMKADEGLLLVNLPRGKRKASGNWDALAKGQVVDCMVSKTNKGGLEVTIGSLRGFIPVSQIDINYVEDPEQFVGQKLTAQVTEINPGRRRLVLSRRALQELERLEAAESIWQTLDEGQTLTGNVKTIKDYGAFIDLGGVDGFLHIGEISWTRIDHPSEIIHEGQQVEVKVLKLDREKSKISLGMKQLAQNPWSLAETNYPKGNTVSGRVTRTTDFGAFVELEPGLEGLIHISELDHRRVKRVTEVVTAGESVEVQVLEVDPKRRRISLSLKALTAAPEPPRDEDLAPSGGEEYVRKHKGPLKGGTSRQESAGGGLFGNPNDYS